MNIEKYLLILVAAMTLCSCQREQVTLRLKIEKPEAKVTINGLQPEWTIGDQIVVNGETAIVGDDNTSTVQTAEQYMAIYPAGLVQSSGSTRACAINYPHQQEYRINTEGQQIVNIPMVGYSTTQDVNMMITGALLAIYVNNDKDIPLTIDALSVKASHDALCGLVTISDNWSDGTTLANSTQWPAYQEGLNDSVLLTRDGGIGHELAVGQTAHYYIFIPQTSSPSNRFTIRVFAHDGNSQGWVYELSQEQNDANQGIGCFGRGDLGRVAFSLQSATQGSIHAADEGTLNGLFSVSQGHQVRFSQGNLQYRASTNAWRFAEHQYDIIGQDNLNISSTYEGWIDLFGWGTSGWNSGAACYHPWDTNRTNSNYYSQNIASTNADWGIFNAISNGGARAGMWRTLTNSEWDYLLNSRSANKRYAKATINGQDGVVIFPDSFDGQGITINNANTYNADYSSNNYSANWDILESRGAVFLPKAGYRYKNNSGIRFNQDHLYYWSSIRATSEQAFALNFSDPNLIIQCGKAYGYSVRLVKDVEK